MLPNELRLLAIIATKYIDMAHTLKALPNLSPEESRDISDCIVKAQTEAAELAKAEAGNKPKAVPVEPIENGK